MVENLRLIVLSFISSFGFAIVFGVSKRDLIWAAVGGAITRCVYLWIITVTGNLFIQYLFSAMIAALYSELMAIKKKTPSAVFLYPTILPLVPGSMLYYIAIDLMLNNAGEALNYLSQLVMALGGICLGFVITSSIRYYKRLYQMGERVELGVKHILNAILGRKPED